MTVLIDKQNNILIYGKFYVGIVTYLKEDSYEGLIFSDNIAVLRNEIKIENGFYIRIFNNETFKITANKENFSCMIEREGYSSKITSEFPVLFSVQIPIEIIEEVLMSYIDISPLNPYIHKITSGINKLQKNLKEALKSYKEETILNSICIISEERGIVISNHLVIDLTLSPVFWNPIWIGRTKNGDLDLRSEEALKFDESELKFIIFPGTSDMECRHIFTLLIDKSLISDHIKEWLSNTRYQTTPLDEAREIYSNLINDFVEKDDRILPKAYQGDDPFVFICYAHLDKKKVYSEIEWLNNIPIHVWYDEGIPPTNLWEEIIPEKINNCTLFIVFLSNNSVKSMNVRREISYAIKYKSECILPIYLEETQLTKDLEFNLQPIQAIMKYKHSNLDFKEKFLNTLKAKKLV